MGNITKAERERRAALLGTSQPEEQAEQADAPHAALLVQMHRDPSTHPLPHAVEVHPDEVENYKRGGFQVTEG